MLRKILRRKNKRYAVIDIGTNAIPMLICEVNPKKQTYDVVLDTTEVTRLGQGLHSTNRLQRSAMDRTCATIRSYLAQASNLGVEQVIAVGTSVLREATNASEFISLVKTGFNLDVEVIPSDAEARFAYLAVRTDETFRTLDTGHLMAIDVGAGSTEFIFGQEEVNTYQSINVGAVHLTDRFLKNDPPTGDELNALSTFLEETLSAQVPAPQSETQKSLVLVGIGGTIVNLASVKLGLKELDIKLIHGETLNRQEIEDQIRLFCSGSLNDRMQIPGLEARRADVITAGAAIFQSILKHVGVDQIYVSTRGVRYGVMYSRFVMYNPHYVSDKGKSEKGNVGK